MLDAQLKTQVTSVFKDLKEDYTFIINIAPSHEKREELIDFLTEVATCSDKIHCDIRTGEGFSFAIAKGVETTSNIVFKTVPTGHEFTTLLLAVLNMDGIGKNLPDAVIIKRIQALQGKITVKSYISLTCTNCPDVVQTLNLLAIYNPNITHEIIDGSIHQEEVDRLNIQAVPSVYANGELLHVGRSSLGELLDKLEKQVGSDQSVAVTATKKEYDMVVVGGGPAGVSSAVYAARKGFSVAIIAEQIGGQVTETVAIENMISIPKTTGSELASNLKLHLDEYPITILENRMVEKFEVIEGIKHVYTSLGEELISPAVIIATGASWRKLNVPGESDYIGSGVAFCTHCDGPFYKDKTVVVVGGGNSGLEAAIDLSSIATKVTVLEFMDTVKGDEVLQRKLKTLDNVTVITSAETLQVIGDGNKVTGIEFKHRETGEVEELSTDGIFVQIGLTANSQVFKETVETNRIGEIEIDVHCRTKTPGVYAAGDVSIVPYKQIVIAMGEGSKAALSAFEDKIKEAQLC
ncbi:MAG: alkyl hydroperoxide reductase subunit F [Flavobacteriaceae bacterium]|nr:alkyl hydroperoxide reductase subunit F [Flavobacteriaceae bacterium]